MILHSYIGESMFTKTLVVGFILSRSPWQSLRVMSLQNLSLDEAEALQIILLAYRQATTSSNDAGIWKDS